MAKETGIGMSITMDDSGGSGRDISNDITNADIAIPRTAQDTTGLDKSATERLLGLADFSATLSGVFDDASNMAHDVFKTVASTSVARTLALAISGQTLSNEVFAMDYALARATTGDLTFNVPCVLQSGTVPTWA
jgi:hypothetical protein|tara:strand:+ start:702 stop:1106 length:405 start_codon:yes stop_codon:yes gene_type:complete